MIFGLRLERNGRDDRPVSGHLKESRHVPGLGDQHPTAVEHLDRIDLGLRPFVFEDRLSVLSHFDRGAARLPLGRLASVLRPYADGTASN